MFNLAHITHAVTGISVAVLTAHSVPWIKTRVHAARRAELLAHADIAVAAAQQRYPQDSSDREAYALLYLKDVGYDIHDQAVADTLKAAVLKLHMNMQQNTK